MSKSTAQNLPLPQQFKPERGIYDGAFGPWVRNTLKISKDITPEMLEPTEADLKLISQLAYQYDEVGTRLAEAIMKDKSIAPQLDVGLREGIAALDNPAPELVEFLEHYENPPEWAYKNDLEEFMNTSSGRKPPNLQPPRFALDGLAMAAGFFVGANYPAVGQSLVATGSVASGTARMEQTMNFVDDISDIRHFVDRGPAVISSARVRLAHGFARKMIERSGKWDKEYYGEYISDFDNMIFLSGLMTGEDRIKGLSDRALQAIRIQMKAVQYLLGAPKELVSMSPLESKRFFIMVVAHLDDSPATAKQVVDSFHNNPYFRPDDTWQGKLSREASFFMANLLTRVTWGNEMADDIGLSRWSHGIPVAAIGRTAANPPSWLNKGMKTLAPTTEKLSKRLMKTANKLPGQSKGNESNGYSGSYGAFK